MSIILSDISEANREDRLRRKADVNTKIIFSLREQVLNIFFKVHRILKIFPLDISILLVNNKVVSIISIKLYQ